MKVWNKKSWENWFSTFESLRPHSPRPSLTEPELRFHSKREVLYSLYLADAAPMKHHLKPSHRTRWRIEKPIVDACVWWILLSVRPDNNKNPYKQDFVNLPVSLSSRLHSEVFQLVKPEDFTTPPSWGHSLRLGFQQSRDRLGYTRRSTEESFCFWIRLKDFHDDDKPKQTSR